MVKSVVLVVDSAQENLDMLQAILWDEYEVVLKSSGEDALDYLNNTIRLPQVILLDIKMQGMDGYQVIKKVKDDVRLNKIPIIVLTGSSSERRALEAGASDYILKPFHQASIKTRIRNQIILHTQMDKLEKQMQQQMDKLTATWDKMLEVMADIIECRNMESGKHVKRSVELYSVLMDDLLDNSSCSDELMALDPGAIIKCVPLHDLGKIGIPDTVLMKPGRLTTEEFEVMKTHTTIGKQLIEGMMADLSGESAYLRHCRDIAYAHHEKYDGSGYPLGLAGDDICLSARIMAVVDVYDALVNKRAYKPASTHDEAMLVLANNMGTHFDPQIVSSALRVKDKFSHIEECYRNC